MSSPTGWKFSESDIDLEGTMTLVLARRTATKLNGWKVEFADDATEALRDMVRRTNNTLGTLTARDYEPSLRISDSEYLAVPDALVAEAAPPLPPRPKAVVESPAGADTSATPAVRRRRAGVQRVETDPQVRALLKRASGLDALDASKLGKQPYLFYAVVIGSEPANRVAFVRKANPIKTLDRGKHWFAFGSRLKKVDEPLLGLDDRFDLAVTNEGVAVLNQDVFDALFRDAKTLVDRYPTWAGAFSTIGLDEDQGGVLVDLCRRDTRLANRIRQIYESGHLAAGNVSLDDVLNQADQLAGGRGRFLKDGKLDFGCADVGTLLKLLNDDLFVGGLSKQHYEAGSKARL